MNENVLLGLIFLAVLLITYLVLAGVFRRREVTKNVGRIKNSRAEVDDNIDRILGSGNEQIKYYLDVVQNEEVNSLRMRLVQAGYFSERAMSIFNLIRFGVTIAFVVAFQVALNILIPTLDSINILFGSFMLGGVIFILCSAVLERRAKHRQNEFRKIFPDFLDLLLVCVEAGLGIDAALDRVTREYLITTPDFGVQLSIINLEIRAGRPVDQALMNFSKRINVDEARSLAVLFKQSQELGASVAQTLRVFSAEMRQRRLLRAEEKANALPVKMLFPMAMFMFPVNLVIILVPILIAILEMLLNLSPQ
ncbi:type II secretion system F family protein [Cognatishimia activa]|uniref:Flp pilus assembly protein TadB n=1 Tax=Cognatishimia activa TaxID=1715691 RepID=A0A0P1J1C1_9RHOB|nr:type II secretion system F family protein [Cognatishimia activa]CUJ18113.1 Flp pilus assembly protein TadB [Cognatishimia activa]CUK27587.1 Flp pilus assembly protein TadB [Cognatishimia activa]